MSIAINARTANLALIAGVVAGLLVMSVPVSAQNVASAAMMSPEGVLAPVPSTSSTATEEKDKPASASAPKTDAAKPEGQIKKVPGATVTPKPKPSPLARWFELQTATVAARYRAIESNKGVWTSNHAQDTTQFKGRFKFDSKAKWTATAVLATGTNFTGGWNNSGWGTGDRVTGMFVKQVFVGWAPVKGVEATYGSMGFVRGEGTEITTFDNDGYMAGERLSVKRPKQFFFDELAATRGYVGDLTTVSIQDRWNRIFGSRNYFQFFASKKVGKYVGVSGDYSHLFGLETWHGAVMAKVPAARVIDTVRVEGYSRTGTGGGSGYSVYGEKTMWKRVSFGMGYATIDPLAPTLNADRFSRGQRYYASGSVKMPYDMTVQVFWGQAFHNTITIANQRRLDVIVNYNVLAGFQRMGWFR